MQRLNIATLQAYHTRRKDFHYNQKAPGIIVKKSSRLSPTNSDVYLALLS